MSLDQLPSPSRLATGVAREASSLADMLLRRVEATPSRRAWRAKQDGRWQETTWKQARDQAAAVATWLARQGLEVGDTVLVVGSTRPQWCLCDLGGQLAGAITVGAYPTLSVEQLGYVIEHSDARVVFAEGAKEVAAVRQIAAQCPRLERIVAWDTEGVPPGEGEGVELVAFSNVLATPVFEDELQRRRAAIEPEHVAIIVYTSGTTGPRSRVPTASTSCSRRWGSDRRSAPA